MSQAGPLSAFAAAKLARQTNGPVHAPSSTRQVAADGNDLAADVATAPYDGHHSGTITPDVSAVEEATTVTPPRNALAVQLSTFRPTKDNVFLDSEAALDLSLKCDETATFVGEYYFTVITGIVTIYGSVLRTDSNPQRVYALSTLALPQIQARQSNTTIRVSSIKSTLRKLEKLSPLFRNMRASNATRGRSFALLPTTEDEPLQRSLNALKIGRDIDQVLRTLSAKTTAEPRAPRIMAVGAKSSGKSTFNRVLCNHLNSWTPGRKCLYLDLDPGQPEFGPSCQISLVEVSAPVLGPAFTHVASADSKSFRLIRSHTIAATTFKDDPEHYEACALDLIRRADHRYPLVVNACGWVTALGASVLTELAGPLGISDVVFLEPLDTALIDTLRTVSNEISFYGIPRQPPRSSSRTPAESWAMQTMAYFHHRLSGVEDVPKWSGKSIDKVRPWCVSYAGPDSGILAILSYSQSPNPEFLAEVLDGSVVAICVLGDDANSLFGSTEENFVDDIDTTPEEIPYVKSDAQGISRKLDPKTTHCVGLALIRGINTVDKEFQLVTPLSESQVAALIGKKVVLVRGAFDAPEWAYLEKLHKGDDAPSIKEEERPWVSRKGMVGIEGAVWRLRHPPLAATTSQGR